MTRRWADRRAATGLLVASLLLFALGGCATRADVSGQSAIATARFAIRDAEYKASERYAPAPLESARANLAAAQKAANAGRPKDARRLAERATVEAQLAEALARKAMAEAKLAEANRVRRENEALRSEARGAAESQR